MSIVKGTFPLAVTLAIVAVLTAILWYGKTAGIGPRHPVFAYLLPIAFLAIFYGSAAATLCAVMATICAAYFLYDPLYSFQVANRLEYGDLICFAMLALLAVKCTVELLRPVTTRLPAARPRYGRL